MKVEGVPLDILQTRTSEKWSRYPHDILPMPVAEMDFELAQPIRDLLVGMVLNSDTGYMGNVDSLGQNFAKFASHYWSWNVEPEQIFICTDVGVGMVEFGRTFLKPGEKVLVHSPVYMNMYNWINELKCEKVDVPLLQDGMDYTIDLDGIEEAYKSGIKAHFLCHPHNPVGMVFTQPQLAQIAELAKQYGVVIMSDEIHGPLVFADQPFVPWLAVSETAREVGVVVTSASKTWNLAGLKCAFIIAQSERMSELAKSMPPSVKFRASLFGAHAAAKAFECTQWYEAMLTTLDRNRKFLKVQLAENLPKARYRIPDSTFLSWIDLSAYELGPNPAEALLERGKLVVTPGHLFGPTNDQFIRLNFATSEEIIADGVHRIVKSLN
jgi:cystathionine beta-lyase